jgi:fatty-acid desaturase
MFRHRAWMSTAAYWTGLAALVSLLWRDVGEGPWQGTWRGIWLPMIVTYLSASVTISVGYHRLFCHGAFAANAFWHRLFAVTGVLFLYSSPLQWAVTHATHHRHSDTELDPHPKPRDALIFKGYRDVPLDTWAAKRLLRCSGQFHLWVDRYYLLIYAALVAGLWLLSPSYVINVYGPVLGMAHFVGGMHNLISHSNGHPRDLAWMEFVLPASGEWLHGHHHRHPGRWCFASRWWHWDLGAWVVKTIGKTP